ncbi:MAG: universal stress protein [Rhodococcus sp. (in: high G+C Gram-positive bacteria)]
MTAKNTIVVGVDGSDGSGRAVAWAASTAVSHGYSLRIVTAVDVPARLTDEQALEFRRVAKSRLTASAEIARGVGGGAALDIAGEARDGNVVDVLLDESARCALVVLGASGLNESDSRLLGSASIGLSAHAHSPVAVVRGRSIDTDGAPGPVVVGIDGSAVNQAAIAAGFDEASRRGAPLVAVHVWSDVSLGQISAVPQQWEDIAASEEAVLAESLAGWQEKYPDVDVRRVVAQDRPVRVLGQMSEEASLIVVGNRGRGGFTGMLLGSTSYALIHTADCPVLVVRGRQN